MMNVQVSGIVVPGQTPGLTHDTGFCRPSLRGASWRELLGLQASCADFDRHGKLNVPSGLC